MRNHDFVSDGFLALTAGGLVLLCSRLVALAFACALSSCVTPASSIATQLATFPVARKRR